MDGWARIRLESPRIGYAPPECRTMQWATESLIEGWFPHYHDRGEQRKWLPHRRYCVERRSFIRTQGVGEKGSTTPSRPAAGRESSTSSSARHIATCSRLPRRNPTAVRCKTGAPDGEICLDTYPHRRARKHRSVSRGMSKVDITPTLRSARALSVRSHPPSGNRGYTASCTASNIGIIGV